MVTVDDNKNLNRLADTLKADPAVFDEGETPGLARKILIYDRPNDEGLTEASKPYIYITIPDFPQQSRYDFGVTSPDSVNQISRQYKIVIIGDSRSKTQTSQQQLYDIVKNVRNSLQADPTFEDPDNPGTDPIFSRSIVVEDPWDRETRGQLSTSISLLLLVTIGSEFTITLPGIGEIPLLSQPNAPEGIVFQDDRTQNGVLNRVITENGDFGAVFVEYESTETLDAALRAKIFAGNEESVTLNIGSPNERTLTVKYIQINPTAQFDEIRRSILHMEITIH